MEVLKCLFRFISLFMWEDISIAIEYSGLVTRIIVFMNWFGIYPLHYLSGVGVWYLNTIVCTEQHSPQSLQPGNNSLETERVVMLWAVSDGDIKVQSWNRGVISVRDLTQQFLLTNLLSFLQTSALLSSLLPPSTNLLGVCLDDDNTLQQCTLQAISIIKASFRYQQP